MAEPISNTDVDAERVRAEHYVQKQQRKLLPGNRYSPDELRQLSESIGSIRIVETEPHVMRLD